MLPEGASVVFSGCTGVSIVVHSVKPGPGRSDPFSWPHEVSQRIKIDTISILNMRSISVVLINNILISLVYCHLYFYEYIL